MNLNDQWLEARDESWKRFLAHSDAKACKGRTCNWSDHGRWLTKGGQPVLFDNPYIPSTHLEQEGLLIAQGWRTLHLPLHMSWYVAGKCQPRLLAPPKSKAELDFLLLLLVLSGYEGNFTVTREYADAGGPEWQSSFANQINKESA
jgi:hypothetical protein